MTLSTTHVKMPPYTGTGLVSTYSFTFRAKKISQIKVVEVDTDGNASLLTLNTDYTVSLSGNGGTITLNAPLALDHLLCISRGVSLKQETSIRNQGPYYAELHEDQFDHMTMIDQQQQEQLDRAPKLAESSTSPAPVFPDPENETYVGYNSLGELEAKSYATVLSDIGAATAADLTAHETDTNNPHSVIASQVAVTPAGSISSNNVEDALIEIQIDVDNHTGDTGNPHGVTAAQVGAPDLAAHSALEGRVTDAEGDITALQLATSSHFLDTANPHGVTASQVGKDTAQWNADRIKGLEVDLSAQADGRVLGYKQATGKIEYLATAIGEANTASNVGTGGVGLFKQKTIEDLEFKNINAGSDKVTVTDDPVNDEVVIDIDESKIDHDSLNGAGVKTHTEIDSHLGDTSNPHSTTADQVPTTPAGNLEAENVQDALDELQSDIDTRATSSDLTTHTGASSGVHGITGSVVGTTDAQTLSKKTFSDAVALTHSATPAAAPAGTILLYPKNDDKVYRMDSSGTEREIGGGALSVTGTRAAPSDIVAGTGIAVSGDQRELQFIQGDSGPVTISANPSIASGSAVGQELVLIGRSNDNTVTINNGNGVELNGSVTLGASDVLTLIWDGTAWVEVSRSN